MLDQVGDAAEMVRDIGRYAREHGQYLEKISQEFADRIQALGRDYAASLLNSERRKLAELEKIMGLSKPRGGADGRAN